MEQMLLWIIIFISFVGMFLMVIDYYMVLKTKDRCDTFANYGVRMKSLGKDDSSIVDGLNTIKNSYFENILIDDLNCVEDNSNLEYQVVFNVQTTFQNMFLSNGELIVAKTAAFNEINNLNISCNLLLRVAQ